MKKLIASAVLLLASSQFCIYAQTNTDFTELHTSALDFSILTSMKQADGEKSVEGNIDYHHLYSVQLSRDLAEKMKISKESVKMQFRIDTFYKKVSSLDKEFRSEYKTDADKESVSFKTFRPFEYSGKSGNDRDLALTRLQDGVIRYRIVKPTGTHGWLHEAVLVVPLTKEDRYASIRFYLQDKTGTVNYKQLDTFLEILYNTVSPNMHF